MPSPRNEKAEASAGACDFIKEVEVAGRAVTISPSGNTKLPVRPASFLSLRVSLLHMVFLVSAVLFTDGLIFKACTPSGEPAFGRRSSVCASFCVFGSRTAGPGG